MGTAIRTSPEMAAIANGAMIRYSDFSDDYFGGSGDTGPHPSDNIGGLFAAAESAGRDSKRLMVGIAIAYEACGQLVDKTALGVRGWDYPVFHAIATALGAGNILGLSGTQMSDALALAIVPNICLNQSRSGDLSIWKGLRGPNGSRNGLFAAELAREGITGPVDPFEGKAGFMKQLGNTFELGQFADRSTAFKIERTYFKCLPIRYTVQLPVLIAFKLRVQVQHDAIESVCVYLEKRSVVTRTGKPEYWDPQTGETANHSSPYLIAAALIDGEITPATFTPQRYRNADVLALTRKIRIEEDMTFTAAFPRTFQCRIAVTTRSGGKITLQESNPRGHPSNPLSDQEIEEKFLKQTDPVLPGRQSRALLDQLWALEKIDDISRLFPLMRVPASRRKYPD